MYGGQKNSYASLVSGRVNTKLTVYYKCILTAFEDICASGCRSREFNWMCWASKERRNEKLKGQLEKDRLPLLMSRTSLSAWFPTPDVILRERKPNKSNYKTLIFENLEDSCGPLIWQTLVIVNVYASAVAKRLQENLSTSDLLPVSNKEMSNAYGGIGFCKEEAKTFAQLLLHWDHRMNNGQPIKIPFLWRHKFPLGCDGQVSKFPIQSLYYPW